jgi:hypothetical protein
LCVECWTLRGRRFCAANELFDEEWVPFAAAADFVDEPFVQRRARERSDDLPGRVVTERLEFDGFYVRYAREGDRERGVRIFRNVFGAQRKNDRGARALDTDREKMREFERFGIGPLHIVDRQEQRHFYGRALERGRDDHEKAAFVPFRGRRRVRRDAEQTFEEKPVARSCRCEFTHRTVQLAQRVDERAERSGNARVVVCGENQGAVAACGCREVFEQA